jgi:hypothetical protein
MAVKFGLKTNGKFTQKGIADTPLVGDQTAANHQTVNPQSFTVTNFTPQKIPVCLHKRGFYTTNYFPTRSIRVHDKLFILPHFKDDDTALKTR